MFKEAFRHIIEKNDHEEFDYDFGFIRGETKRFRPQGKGTFKLAHTGRGRITVGSFKSNFVKTIQIMQKRVTPIDSESNDTERKSINDKNLVKSSIDDREAQQIDNIKQTKVVSDQIQADI